MRQDAVILLTLIACVAGVYWTIFFYAWKANKEKAKRVDAEIKLGENETDEEIDKLSLSDLIVRANKRDRQGK